MADKDCPHCHGVGTLHVTQNGDSRMGKCSACGVMTFGTKDQRNSPETDRALAMTFAKTPEIVGVNILKEKPNG